MGQNQKETDINSTLSVFQTIIETMEEGVAIVDKNENLKYCFLDAAKLLKFPMINFPDTTVRSFCQSILLIS